MKCKFVVVAVPENINLAFSPMRAEVRCETHNMPLESQPMTSGDLCPIGRIEEARDQALASIAAAIVAAE